MTECHEEGNKAGQPGAENSGLDLTPSSWKYSSLVKTLELLIWPKPVPAALSALQATPPLLLPAIFQDSEHGFPQHASLETSHTFCFLGVSCFLLGEEAPVGQGLDLISNLSQDSVSHIIATQQLCLGSITKKNMTTFIV